MKKFSDMTPGDVSKYLTDLGTATASILPLREDGEGPAIFILIVSGDLGPGEGHYVSNIVREDAVRWLRETADRIERKQDYNTLG